MVSIISCIYFCYLLTFSVALEPLCGSAASLIVQ